MMMSGNLLICFKVLARESLGFVNYEAWGVTVPWIFWILIND